MGQWFPELTKWLDEVPDKRKFHQYTMANMLMQGIFLFICQGGSRNAMNNKAAFGEYFKENFCSMFPEMKWAHFDSVDGILRNLTMEELEKVKTKMIKTMINGKRINTCYEGYYMVAVDATGVTSYDEEPEGDTTHRKSANGKITYLNYMLEAKLVTPEGLSFSIASEPLGNSEHYEKQDCELKGFKRLALKLKKFFPRLPICVLIDGLYANNPVFDICEKNGWKFIVNLKDACLSSLQETIEDTENSDRTRFEKSVCINKKQKHKQYATASYQWIDGLQYKTNTINWLEVIWPDMPTDKDPKPTTKYVYLTNITPKDKYLMPEAIVKIAACGRLRWKIENEGFNVQKNQGYNLEHKYSRSSVDTLHVYYIMLQIAHIINQLVVHTREVARLLKDNPKLTFKHLWETLRALLEFVPLSKERLEKNVRRSQIRLE